MVLSLLVIFAFFALSSMSSCKAKPENCTKCKIFPVGEGFASEFRLKASEKGVRLVYVNLKIGNESYNPLDVPDKFLSNNWVWANTINEPMLALSYDYDILSLGLLTYQVGRMDVQLADKPSGCLANLNSSCQDKVVARALLNLTEHDSGERSHGTDVVCNTVIRRNVVVYRCCGKNKQGSAKESSVKCELVVERSSWFQAFNYILFILTMIMAFYCPAFLLALPDCIFNLRHECEQDKKIGQRQDQVCINEGGEDNENDSGEDNQGTSEVSRESDSEKIRVNYNLVYLDDASPITCSTFFSRHTKDFTDLVPFNFKLAFLCYCLIPIFEYISVGLNYALKREFFEEALRKQQPGLVGYWLPFFLNVQYTTLFAVSPLVMILFATPNDFLLTGFCPVCREEMSSIGEDIFRHIKNCNKIFTTLIASWLIKKHKACITIIYCTQLCLQIITPPCKRLKRALIVLLVLLCNAILITICWGILGVVYFCIFLVGFLFLSAWYSPLISIAAVVIKKSHQFGSFLGVSIRQLREHSSLLGSRFLCIPFTIAIIGSSFFGFFLSWLLGFAVYTGTLSGKLIAKMFGYVIMGLVLNADIASPFVTFFVVASTNMYLCYYNLQKKYQEVKEMISQQWQKHKHLLENSNLSNNEEGTIPEDLFWYICDEKSISQYKVLPVRSEVFRMLFNMALILTFLFLTLSSIIFLERAYSISAVVSTIAVFVSGVIPGLFFKGLTRENRFSGAIKSEMINKIEKAVKEFIVIVSILEPFYTQEVRRSCWI